MVHVIRLGLAGGLLIMMALARQNTGTWANPVGFYAGTFMVITLGQEAMLPGLPFSELMAAMILGSTIALFLGMLVTWRRPERTADPPPLYPGRRAARTLGLCAAFTVALLYLYESVQARATGLGVTDSGLFDRAQFFALGGQTLYLRALQALTYCGVLYVAFEARLRRRPVVLVGAYLLIVFVQGITFSTKLAFLISSLLVLAVIVSGYPTRFGRVNRRVLAGAAGALLIVLLTFHIVTALRHKGAADVSAVTGYSILAPPSAYSLVLDGNASVDLDPRWGMTIAGPRDLLLGEGDTRRFGVYAQSVQFNAGQDESATNIYTWFLPLRHDFGVPGTFVIIFGLGLAAGALATRQLAGTLGPFGQTALALLNLELLFAPIFTLTYYNFTPLLLVIGLLLAWLYADPARSRHVHEPGGRRPPHRAPIAIPRR